MRQSSLRTMSTTRMKAAATASMANTPSQLPRAPLSLPRSLFATSNQNFTFSLFYLSSTSLNIYWLTGWTQQSNNSKTTIASTLIRALCHGPLDFESKIKSETNFKSEKRGGEYHLIESGTYWTQSIAPSEHDHGDGEKMVMRVRV